jgi:hypothetical protein
MPRKTLAVAPSAPSTALAAVPAAPKGTITRAEANKLLQTRSVELFQEARRKQQQNRTDFEGQFGSIDRIDDSLLRDLQALQMRFAAIAARQRVASYGEPKVSKFVATLGALIGDVSAHLATERAVTLFEPIREHDYVGYNGGIGSLGMDESVLDGYAIVDDAPAPTRDDDGEVCLHEDMQESDDQPGQRYCGDCGAEFAARAGAHAT